MRQEKPRSLVIITALMAPSQSSVSHSWGCRGPTDAPASKKSEARGEVPPTHSPIAGVTLAQDSVSRIRQCMLSKHLVNG